MTVLSLPTRREKDVIDVARERGRWHREFSICLDSSETGDDGEGGPKQHKSVETDGNTELRFHLMVADDMAYVTSNTTDVFHSNIMCQTIQDHTSLRRLRHCKVCAANAEKRH